MSIEHVRVESSNIESWGYDGPTHVLEIRFKERDGSPGRLYRYREVAPDVVAGLRTASSVGKYFAQHIKPHYPGVQA